MNNAFLCYNKNDEKKFEPHPINRFQALKKVTSFISHISNFHKLLDCIMEESKKILNAEASSLLLYNEEEKVLFFEVAKGRKGKQVKNIRLHPG